MWNFGYHFARARGAAIRRSYRRRLHRIVAKRVDVPRSLDLDVFAYSGEATLPEQVASLRSFLAHAGSPVTFHIVSDGTHSAQSKALLTQVHPCVQLHDASLPERPYAEPFRSYLANHATGRQLALIMSLPRDRPALYIDSDVLFFEGANALVDVLKAPAASAFYLQDCQFSGDDRLLEPHEVAQPVNTGVVMLFRPLDWSIAEQRFAKLGDATPTFFTNQTLTHLVMHANSAVALDPAKFVLQLDDQFVFADRYAGRQIALRHYVNPVRHKFWTSLARAT